MSGLDKIRRLSAEKSEREKLLGVTVTGGTSNFCGLSLQTLHHVSMVNKVKVPQASLTMERKRGHSETLPDFSIEKEPGLLG